MLYIVSTPIGNLDDISYRAVEVLKKVTVIACEDTRRTKKLLSYYEISTRCISCHSYNQEKIYNTLLLPLLKKGEDVALVSDAGTPCISDPGAVIVEHVYNNDIAVTPIVGASAITALVSVSGLHGKGFWFEGFLQRKKNARLKRLSELLEKNIGFVLFESPYRIEKLLEEITSIDSQRCVLMGREMTKKFEHIHRALVSDLLQMHRNNEVPKKGEYTVFVYPQKRIR